MSEDTGATFNIGSQQAGTISNVGRDQTVGHLEGALHASVLRAVADLRAAIADDALPQPARQQADQALDAVEGELGRPTPDKARVAARLEGLLGVLSRFGMLATATEHLIAPLQRIATWLGPAGRGLLDLLR